MRPQREVCVVRFTPKGAPKLIGRNVRWRPIADIRQRCDDRPMRCYCVLIHGTLHWNVAAPSEEVNQPRGFYCHRYVLASDEESAARIAFRRVRANLDRVRPWLSDGS